jgi:hypothetical protein
MKLVIRVKLGVVIVSLAGQTEEYSFTQDADGAIDGSALVAVIKSLEQVEQEAAG